MKNFIFKILSFLLVFISLSVSVSAKEKYNLVLFYADWNVYSQQAIDVLSSIAENSKKISFEKVNIDDKKAFVRMKQLGVMPTNSLPYYFLMDNNKKIIYGSVYQDEKAEDLSQIFIKQMEH